MEGVCPQCKCRKKLSQFVDAVDHGSRVDLLKQQEEALEKALREIRKELEKEGHNASKKEPPIQPPAVLKKKKSDKLLKDMKIDSSLFQSNLNINSSLTMNISKAAMVKPSDALSEIRKQLNKMASKAASFRVHFDIKRNLLSVYTSAARKKSDASDIEGSWRLDRSLADINDAKLSNDEMCSIRVTFKRSAGILVLHCNSSHEASSLVSLINDHGSTTLTDSNENQIEYACTCKKSARFGRLNARYVTLKDSTVTLWKDQRLRDMEIEIKLSPMMLPVPFDDRSVVLKQGEDIKIRFSSSAERNDFMGLCMLFANETPGRSESKTPGGPPPPSSIMLADVKSRKSIEAPNEFSTWIVRSPVKVRDDDRNELAQLSVGTQLTVSEVAVLRKGSIRGRELHKAYIINPEPHGWVQLTNHKGDPFIEKVNDTDLYGGSDEENVYGSEPPVIVESPSDDKMPLTRATSLSISSTNSFHSRQSRFNVESITKLTKSLSLKVDPDRMEKGRRYMQELEAANSMGDMRPDIAKQFENKSAKKNKSSVLFFTDRNIDDIQMSEPYPTRKDDTFAPIFWILKRIGESIKGDSGAKFRSNFFFPKEIWNQRNVKFIAYPLKLQTCNDIKGLLSATFDRVQKPNYDLDTNAQQFKAMLQLCVMGSQKNQKELSRYLKNVKGVKSQSSIFAALGNKLDKAVTRAIAQQKNVYEFSEYVERISLITEYGTIIERCYNHFLVSESALAAEITEMMNNFLAFIAQFCIIVVNDMQILSHTYRKRAVQYLKR